MSEASGRIVHLPRWLPPSDAAAALGISERQLRRKAGAGEIERRKVAGRAEYRVTADAGQDVRTDVRTDTPDTSDARPDASDVLRDELASLRAALVDAERRAAVAEYRAEIADADAEELEALRGDVEHLRDELHQARAERDEARTLAQTYGDALRRRHATVQRLLQRLRGA